MTWIFVIMYVCVSWERFYGPYIRNVDRMESSASRASELVDFVRRSLDCDQAGYTFILSYNPDDYLSAKCIIDWLHFNWSHCSNGALLSPGTYLHRHCFDSEDALAVLEDSELEESDAVLAFHHAYVVVEVSYVRMHLAANVYICWAEDLH